MSQGDIIFLNGTSSCGKSSIAMALQDVLEAPYLHTGIDQLLTERVPRRLIARCEEGEPAVAEGWLAMFRDGALTRVQVGPIGHQWIAGMYRAIATLADAGVNIIVDDVIHSVEILDAAVAAFAAHDVYFVGVRCSLEAAEQRERDRGDRNKGGARTFFHLVHAHGIYDLEVDSSHASPAECAMQIRNGLQARPMRSAFNRLRERS